MADTAPNMGIKYNWALGTYFKAEMDANLKKLDRFYMPVLSTTIGTPPGSPTAGDRYIIPNTGATGAWIGNETKVATYVAGAWEYDAPVDGLALRDLETDELFVYDAAAGGSTDGAWVSDQLAAIKSNLRGIAIVDMGNADYVMSDAEAKCGAIAVVNAGDGTKTITIPSSSDSVAAGLIAYLTYFNSAGFYIKSETYGGSGQYCDALIGDLILHRPASINPSGMIAFAGLHQAQGTHRGFYGAGSANVTGSRNIRGKTVFLDAPNLDYIIPQSLNPLNETETNALAYVIADYSGCRIVAENTAQNVIFPAGPYLEIGQRYTIARDSNTETYRVWKG